VNQEKLPAGLLRAAISAAETRVVVCPSGHTIEIGGGGRDWPNFEALKAAVLTEWVKTKPVPSSVSIIPGRRGEQSTYA
jgi:hypothetical protein